MTASVLAQMWEGDHMGDGWWWVMGIGWLVFLTLIVVLVYLLIRHLTDSGRGAPTRSSAGTCSPTDSPEARSTRRSTGVAGTRSGPRNPPVSPTFSPDTAGTCVSEHGFDLARAPERAPMSPEDEGVSAHAGALIGRRQN